MKSLDTTRYKRVGVITYFGVYALLLFEVHVAVNAVLATLPAAVRPPPVEPVWVLIDLPQSLAMGLFSLAVTALVVGTLVVKSVLTTVGEPGSGTAADHSAQAWREGATGSTRPEGDEWTRGSGGPTARHRVHNTTSLRDGGSAGLDEGRGTVHGMQSGVSDDRPAAKPAGGAPGGTEHADANPGGAKPAGSNQGQHQGDPASPEGDRLAPAEDTGSPEGDSFAPDRDSISPEGRIVAPEGESSGEDPWPDGWMSGDELSASSKD